MAAISDGQALFGAIISGNTDAALGLVGQGAFATLNWVHYETGWTPLMAASSKGNTQVVEAILAAGVQVGFSNEKESTAMSLACQNGHLNVVEALVAAGGNVDGSKTDGTTNLMLACHGGHKDVAEALIRAGADVNKTRKTDGATALVAAALEKHVETCKLLLEFGAEVPSKWKQAIKTVLGEQALKNLKPAVKKQDSASLVPAGLQSPVATKKSKKRLL